MKSTYFLSKFSIAFIASGSIGFAGCAGRAVSGHQVVSTTSTIAQRSPAQAQDNIELNGVDVGPIVRFIRQHTETLVQPKTVYNWAYRKDLQKRFTSNGSDAVLYARNYADVYWNSQEAQSKPGDLYGRGFYAAKDPVASADYGIDWKEGHISDQNNWVMVMSTLPAGFRILELDRNVLKQDDPVVVEMGAAMGKLGCKVLPNVFGKSNAFSIYDLMAPRWSSSQLCRDSMASILQKIAPINAMGYGFQSTAFDACQISGEEPKIFSQAFIIMSSNWINRDSIHVFNRLSSDSPQERKIIQAMFDEASREKLMKQDSLQLWRDIPRSDKLDHQTAATIEFANTQKAATEDFMQKNHFGCSKSPF